MLYYYKHDKLSKILMKNLKYLCNHCHLFTLTILYILLFQQILNYDLSYQEFLQSTPQTFGLLTVTHARGGDYDYFKKHLNHYASMQCQLMSEFSIVWNNDISPQQAGIKQQSSWKRPIYFKKTPYNSMDFRYLLPDQSTAKVFFSIDDDVTISCQELTKGFNFWKTKSVGDIGPLIGYGLRGFNINLEKQEIKYTDPLKKNFYYLTLIGIAWVPRHFFQIYNSNAIQIIQQMRQIVQQKNNCDDIALNYIVGYLYPQFVSIPITGEYRMVGPRISQGYSPNHYPYRNFCVKKFIQIMGYCPMRLIDKTFDPDPQRRQISYQFPFRKQTIYMKRKLIAQKFIQKDEQQKSQLHYSNKYTQSSQIRNQNTQDTFSLKQKIILEKKIRQLEQQLQKQKSDSKNKFSNFQENQQAQIIQGSLTIIQQLIIVGISIIVILLIYFIFKKQNPSYRIVDQNIQ